jgi:hypothetical protein
MKALIHPIKTILLGFIMLVVFIPVSAQSKKERKAEKTAALSRLIEARQFVFVAETANSGTGGFWRLNTAYDMTVKGDSLVSYLPYYGRAFSVQSPYGSGGGINFTSTNYHYTVKQKKDEWIMVMEPRDVSDVRQIMLNIFENGRASLSVISTSRQQINYTGYITEKRK